MSTTTVFKGDIQFKAGEEEIKASELATIDQVNTALATIGNKHWEYNSTTNYLTPVMDEYKLHLYNLTIGADPDDNKDLIQEIAYSNNTSNNTDNAIPTTAYVNKYATTNHYTKTESDNKYALKTAIPTNHVTTSSLTTKLNDYALKTYTYSKTESDNKYALKTAIPTNHVTTTTLNSTLANYMNGANMLSMLINSMNGYACPIDYVTEGQKYVSWIELNSTFIRITTTNEFTTKRLLIMYIKIRNPIDKNNRIITVIDRKNLNGLAIIYNDERIHVTRTKWTYNSSNKGYLADYEDEPMDDLQAPLDMGIDEIPDYSTIYLLYFKVIDDGDDKTVASNLLGALMKLSQAENEYKCKNIQ